ncbi:VWA domain-containing protein [Actinokineospora auranticolor]|uniref:von Willebrand factor type A domain-containing protein n=1 Tax=Actinokineospora auranticolor TaxID=155976 RepID=A0A2S6GL53_9PSEU|nr:VWA domain-containing protein [Actinokineospora auranticolor]PPK65881.1 von Willebrand factor type A domain-containing protein [Actinokineospora auranticolor]
MRRPQDLHTTILAVDVERFGDPRRTDRDRSIVRAGLHDALRRAMDRARIPWGEHENTGDGLLMLLSGVAKGELVSSLPHELAAALREHNADHNPEARIRLRVVVHAGEVGTDAEGRVGNDLNHAFRLLDSAALRKALADSPGVLAVAVSDWFHEHVLKHQPAANPAIYHPSTVRKKETRTTAWIATPDYPTIRSTRPKVHFPHLRVPALPKISLPRPKWEPVGLALLLCLALTTNVLASATAPVAACANPVQLNVLTSTELAPTLRQLALEFERVANRADDDGCRKARVLVVADTYSGAVDALGRGWAGINDARDHGPEPHVWIPDSSTDVAHVTARLAAAAGIGAVPQPRPGIARSPLVLAVPPDVVGDLRPDRQRFDWASVDRARDTIAFARPDPDASSAGMLATIALYRHRLGRGVLDTAAMSDADVPRRAHDVELTVPATEQADSGALLCALRSSPGRMAVLVSEKAALDYNRGALVNTPCAGTKPDRPLTLLYPRDGTPVLDHPYVVMRWTDRPENPRRAQVIDQFHGYLLARAAQETLRNDGFRNVNGRPGPYEGPVQEWPAALEVGADTDDEAVLRTARKARVPARVLFAVDTAASMSQPSGDGTRGQAAANAIRDLLPLFGARDEVGLATSSGVVVELGRGNSTAVRSTLRPTPPPSPGATDVYGLLNAGVDHLRAKSEQTDNDLLILFTDGATANQALVDLTELKRRVSAPSPSTEVLVVSLSTDRCFLTGLREVADATGGWCLDAAGAAALADLPSRVAAGLWRRD